MYFYCALLRPPTTDVHLLADANDYSDDSTNFSNFSDSDMSAIGGFFPAVGYHSTENELHDAPPTTPPKTSKRSNLRKLFSSTPRTSAKDSPFANGLVKPLPRATPVRSNRSRKSIAEDLEEEKRRISEHIQDDKLAQLEQEKLELAQIVGKSTGDVELLGSATKHFGRLLGYIREEQNAMNAQVMKAQLLSIPTP